MSNNYATPNAPESSHDFYSKSNYFAELNRQFAGAGAGTRILLMTMVFDPQEPAVAELIENLIGAASRGADVTLAVDARSFISHHGLPGPLWYHAQLKPTQHPPYRLMLELLNRLNSFSGSRAIVINQPGRPFNLPIAGRSHIKTAIIDDYLFIGGCNLDSPLHIDLMTGWRNARVADELYSLMRQIIDDGIARRGLSGSDRTIAVSSDTKLLIDAGVRNQSIIFDEALKLIDAAQDWLTITCQFFPNSITAQHLLQAQQRGVKLDIIYADPAHHGIVGGAGQRYSIAREKRRLPANMFRHVLLQPIPLLHAKLIACDQGLMLGSHNYVRAGVRLGTAEIALKSGDVQLAQQASDSLQLQLQ